MNQRNEQKAQRRARPLSPHLTVYRPQITSVLSITHRATGVLLAIGAGVIVWILAGIAGIGCPCGLSFIATPAGQILTSLWILALAYHFCNGIRHLFWDVGRGFELKNVTRSGLLVLLIAGASGACVVYHFLTAGGLLNV